VIRRARRRARGGLGVPRPVVIAGAVLAVAAVLGGGNAVTRILHPPPPAPTATGSPGRAALAAVSFARHQIGCPYQWGGTGPCSAGFDCSGLVMMAYASAGVTIPRTSETQWAGLRHVTAPRKGDLVFFAGSDGTTTSPGHVGLVLGPHRMIDAYATGFPVTAESFGLPSSRQGLTSPAGFTRPVHLTRATASYTRATWARALLHATGFQATPCNVGAVVAWETAEGGHWGNTARYNPLDDTRPMPGSRPMNSKHVQVYTSWTQGLDAAGATLGGPDYGGIRAALSAGNNAQAVATAVGASVWGTQRFLASC